MRPSRISALLTAVVLSFSLISCSDNNTDVPRIQRERNKDEEFRIGQSYAVDDEDIPDDIDIPDDEVCDISDIEKEVQLLISHIDDKKEENVIKDDIQNLLDMYDLIYDAHTNMEIVFYRNYNDKALESEYNRFYRAAYVAKDLIDYGFVYGFDSKYSDLFKDLVDEDDLIKYDGEYDLETARINSESSFDDQSEALSSYYDVENDDSLSNKEKDLKCAEILLDLISDYDTEKLYSQYDRDYTGDEILDLSKTVKSELIPVNKKLTTEYLTTADWSSSYYDEVSSSNPFKIIREYAPRLSDDISKSADIICDEKLYSIFNDSEAFQGAFTDDLPTNNRARVFIGNVGSENVLRSAIHEFGHFHACLYDETPSYLFKNNMDIAEIQSQGFELLFMQFYDDIYGDSSDSMKLEQVIDLLDSVICGFLIGEFEYTVVRDKDDLTPQEVVDLFNDLFSEYNPFLKINNVPHLFESPGYYISYATSSLAAFDIFEDLLNDPQKALEQYEKIAKTSFNSGEFTFKMALKECGFSDVLTKEYITALADELSDYAESF